MEMLFNLKSFGLFSFLFFGGFFGLLFLFFGFIVLVLGFLVLFFPSLCE